MSSGGAGRSTSVVGAALVVLGVAGCGSTGAAVAECGELERLPDSGHHHLTVDAEPPVPYATAPPTSGWHYRDRDHIAEMLEPGAQPLAEPSQVSVLAVGGVVVSYADDLDEEEVARLETAVTGSDAVAVLTPYAELDPGQVAMTAWTTRQVCEGVDREAVTAFIDEHAAATPDFDMGGQHGGH